MTGDGLFGLSLDLSDDYGLVEVSVGVVPSGGDTNILQERTTLGVSDLRNFSGDAYLNLSKSDLAGQKVDLILEAVDQAGQKQQKIISDITLPGKEFSNPVSRKIIEIRDEMARNPEDRKKIARQLMALGLVPDDGRTPIIYYMALRAAYWRLTNPSEATDLNNARDILWDLAGTLEEGKKGQFTSEIMSLLAALKRTLHQRRDMDDIRDQLQEIDKTIVLFLRAQLPTMTGQFAPEDYNLQELRQIYGRILTHGYNKNYAQAIDLVAFLEHGFIYSDKGLLSGQGYKRFQIVQNARDMVHTIEKTQRKVMSFVFKKSVKLEVALSGSTMDRKAPFKKDIENWITIQQKLGDTVNDLGRTLLQSGIDASQLTVATSDLVRDVANSMEAGEMEVAAQYQSEILILLKSLKNLLDREMIFSPEINPPKKNNSVIMP